MSGGILTPVSIWNDFNIEGERNVKIAEEYISDGVIVSRFYIDGKKTDGAPVRIFCVSARSEKISLIPCIYVLSDFDKDIDEDFLVMLAKRGYFAFSTDFSGAKEGKKYYTAYPSGSEYANYLNAKSNLCDISGDVRSTAWYEWDCVGKYALSYVSTLPFITGTGAVGVGKGASVLWHLAANNEKLSAAAFLLDAGWNAYFNKNNCKFDGEAPEFNDSDMKFLAGVDAQAYAPFVNIPSLILSATNSAEYDFDRAADTITRINKAVYSAIDYSVNASRVLDSAAFTDLTVFLDAILLKGYKPEAVFPAPPDIDCEIDDGKIEIEVDAVKSGLKKVILYAAEGKIKQQYRAWKIGGEIYADDLCDGQFFFNYVPYGYSGVCYFFVRAEYENGFTVASNVINKKFTDGEIQNPNKSKVIFSGRERFCGSVFAPFYDENSHSFIDAEKRLSVKKGPMDIYGIYSETGLITYKINAEKDKPAADSIFLIDVYFETDANISVSLIAADKKEYSFIISAQASKVWRNYKIAVNKFKSADGFYMKDYSLAVAIKITGEGKYLINNFLWI